MSHNQATRGSGGHVHIAEASRAVLTSCTLSNGAAALAGGGIAVLSLGTSTRLRLASTTLHANSAEVGGGMFVSPRTFSTDGMPTLTPETCAPGVLGLDDVVVEDNVAGRMGGGIFWDTTGRGTTVCTLGGSSDLRSNQLTDG